MRRSLAIAIGLLMGAVMALLPGAATAAPSAPQRTEAATVPGQTEAANLTSRYQLLSAPIPSVCGHPAGRLVNGQLPGIATYDGFARLRFGTVKLIPVASGGTGAVAAIECNRGGVPWPNHVIVWDRNKRVIGHFDLRKMSSTNRAYIKRFAMSKGVVYGYMTGIAGADEGGCCQTRTGRVALGWSSASRRYIVKSRFIYYEKTYARLLVSAVNRRDRTRALRYASSSVVNELLSAPRRKYTLHDCYATSRYPAYLAYPPPTHYGRGCTITSNASYDETYALAMTHPGGAMAWKATDYRRYSLGGS